MYNRNFFREQSISSAYFAGLLIADGTIARHKPLIQLAIVEDDIELLHNFCDAIQSDYGRIRTQTPGGPAIISGKNTWRRPQKRVSIYGKDEALFLKKTYGLVPNKTRDFFRPQIPERLIMPFVIGLIDGDGHIRLRKGTSRAEISIALNPEMSVFLRRELERAGISATVGNERQKHRMLYISKQRDVYRLVKYAQECLEGKVLRRKWERLNYMLMPDFYPAFKWSTENLPLNEIFQEYDGGATIKEISARLDIGQRLISNAIKDSGRAIRSFGEVSVGTKQEILHDFQEGMNVTSIMKKYRKSHRWVKRLLASSS